MNEQEIKERFLGLTNLSEVKKVFKTLAKLLHPDVSNRDSVNTHTLVNPNA